MTKQNHIPTRPLTVTMEDGEQSPGATLTTLFAARVLADIAAEPTPHSLSRTEQPSPLLPAWATDATCDIALQCN